jgi:hypothetical protein
LEIFHRFKKQFVEFNLISRSDCFIPPLPLYPLYPPEGGIKGGIEGGIASVGGYKSFKLKKIIFGALAHLDPHPSHLELGREKYEGI